MSRKREEEHLTKVLIIVAILLALGGLIAFLGWLTQQWWFIPALVLAGVGIAIWVWSMVKSKNHSRYGGM